MSAATTGMETPSNQITTKVTSDKINRTHRHGKMYIETHIVFFKDRDGTVQLTEQSRAYRYKLEADRMATELNRKHFDSMFGDFVVKTLEIKM